MNIHLSNCATLPDHRRDQKQSLGALWARSSKKHALVESPEQADIIIIGNIQNTNWFENLRCNPLVSWFTDKCFAVSEDDWFLPFLRGIYANAQSSTWLKARCRSGSYALIYPDFTNPYVNSFCGCAAELAKHHLASFTGRDCHTIRSTILRQPYRRQDIHVLDTSRYNAFTDASQDKASVQIGYVETLARSKFAICPRGSGASSMRLFEAMRIGVAPVVISDDWVFPQGPDWASFSLIVKEDELSRLEEILCSNEFRYVEMGRLAATAYQRYFSDENYFDYLIDQMIGIRSEQLLPERWFWRFRGFSLFVLKAKRRLLQIFGGLDGDLSGTSAQPSSWLVEGRERS